MNRIYPPAESTGRATSSATFDAQSSLFTPSLRDSSYALFAPLHYEPKYAYPLIVWLHAQGTDGERQLLSVMPEISTRNYVAVAPRGFLCGDAEPAARHDWPQSQDRIEEAEHRVFQCIATARRKWNVARRRIFVAGFGSGGTMAFRVALNRPRQFAGVLSICGEFPRGHNPLSQLIEARRLPVLLAVGRDSREYSPAEACDDLRLFHTAGMSIALRQYPCGQQLTPQMLRDVDRWIIEQITASSGPASEADNCWPCPSE